MIYVLNLYDLIPGKEDQYRDYMRQAGPLLAKFGARPVVTAHAPLAMLEGDNERAHMIIVEFPDKSAFDEFYAAADAAKLHPLREGATRNYIWTVYDGWDLGAWLGDA
jgi:uncharacterized protein (DUF1330 family)